MASNVLQVLHSPGRFFKSETKKPVRLLVPIAIVLAFMILRAVANYVFYSKMVHRLPESIASGIDWMTFGFGVSLVSLLISDLVFWFVGAGILTCINILLDGDGEYRKILELSGYAHLPLLIFAVIVFGYSLVYTPAVDFTAYEQMDLEAIKNTDREHYSQILSDIQADLVGEVQTPVFIGFASAKVCFYLWLAVLVTVANARAFQMPIGKSSLSVLGIILLYVAIEILRHSLFPGAV